ncbi:MAG: dockerin type I domain-containing protein [candidate division Zixibacteria bacterium]|nr:dockerin type I domain-containing protein [candidate division Zixibacteria bacterium]
MDKSKILKFKFFVLVICIFVYFNLFTQSRSQNYKMFTDVLDELGGRAQSANYLLRIGTGGQPSVVGLSKADSLWARQGYVNTAAFVHADDNADGRITVADVVYEINHLFKGGPPSRPPEVCDVNCDNHCDVSDVVYKINYLFKGGPPPCNL